MQRYCYIQGFSKRYPRGLPNFKNFDYIQSTSLLGPSRNRFRSSGSGDSAVVAFYAAAQSKWERVSLAESCVARWMEHGKMNERWMDRQVTGIDSEWSEPLIREGIYYNGGD